MIRSWQFLSGPGTCAYSLFDALRRGVNRGLVRFFQRHVLRPGCRVLEAGSGPAHATSVLAGRPEVRLAVALDVDLEALREARRRDGGVCAVAGDAYHLPFRRGTFDLVWSSSTLEHLARPDRALAEMSDAARDAGHVFVGVPYRGGPLCFQRDLARTGVGVWIGTVFGRDEICALLRRQDLLPIRTLTYFARFFVGVLARRERRRTESAAGGSGACRGEGISCGT